MLFYQLHNNFNKTAKSNIRTFFEHKKNFAEINITKNYSIKNYNNSN
jgi:hypothetical protein